MTTFVTSLLYVHENIDIDINIIENRVRHFRDLAKTGIQLCVYLSHEYIDFFYNILHDCPNVKIAKFVDLTKTETYKTCFLDGPDHINWSLPYLRNSTKDIRPIHNYYVRSAGRPRLRKQKMV